MLAIVQPGPSWLDRLQSSPVFRDWARRMPFTRPVARARAAALFDLCAGFVYAQVLLACVRLDLFATLAEGPRDAAWLAERCDIPAANMARLLDAAVALRLVSRRGHRVGLGPLGAAMVGNAGVAAMVEHHAALYADMADPVALLRGRAGALARMWPYARSGAPASLQEADTGPYSGLMAESQALVAAEILDAYPLRRHRRLLDVGGGHGAFLREVGQRVPGLQRHLFDLPAVVREVHDIESSGGDMFRDPLPRGADLVSLVRVLHDHDDDSVRRLLRAVRAALPPGGTVLVAEPMAGTAGAERMGHAYFGMYLLAMGQGRPRTAKELAEMLAEAGFSRLRRHRTRMPLITSLLSAVNLT